MCITPRVVYGATLTPFMDRELKNECENDDISQLKRLYQILVVKNLLKSKQVGRIDLK